MHNTQVEETLLALVLKNPELYHEVTVTEKAFTDSDLGNIFTIIGHLVGLEGNSGSFSYSQLVTLLPDKKEIIDNLYSIETHNDTVESCNNILSENLRKRVLDKTLLNAVANLKNENSDKVVTNLLDSLFADDCATTEAENAEDIARVVAEELKEQAKNGVSAGLNTDIPELDESLGGFRKGDLILIPARPSIGKTAMMLQLANNLQKYASVGIVSLEMSRKQLIRRLLCSVSGFPLHKVFNNILTDEERGQLGAFGERINNIYIDDASGIDIYQLQSIAYKMKRRFDIQVLFVDYLQLVRGKGSNGNEKISSVSAKLKELAKELDIVVIGLSQLSRECERRGDKMPQLSDLRDSGSLEQDADIVLMLYRDEYYRQRGFSHNREHVDHSVPDNGIMVKCAKFRNGALFTVTLKFDLAIQRITSMQANSKEELKDF